MQNRFGEIGTAIMDWIWDNLIPWVCVALFVIGAAAVGVVASRFL